MQGMLQGGPQGFGLQEGAPQPKPRRYLCLYSFGFFFFGLSLHSYQVSRLLKHLLQTYWGLGSPGTSMENHTEEGEVTLPPGGAYLRGSRPWVTPGALP